MFLHLFQILLEQSLPNWGVGEDVTKGMGHCQYIQNVGCDFTLILEMWYTSNLRYIIISTCYTLSLLSNSVVS